MVDCRGHKMDLVHLKVSEVAMPLIPDKAAFQNSLASLPIVTYQPGETVIVDGSKTGRLLFLKKGNVAIVKDDTEIAKVAEPGAVFGELCLARPTAHSGRACIGNLAVSRSQCDRASRTKSDCGAVCCNCARTPARWRE
jgi:CRP-like cAMP-binding protein